MSTATLSSERPESVERLATRLATLPLLGMLAVIQTFVYPNAWSDHLTWGSILLFLLTRGGGALSLDRLLRLEPASPRQE